MKDAKDGGARAPRIQIDHKVMLTTSDGNELAAIVTNVSAQGFRFKVDETLYDGENILIGEMVVIREKGRNDVRARIIWIEGCDAGGVFLERPTLSEAP